jgi:general stress protein YciG
VLNFQEQARLASSLLGFSWVQPTAATVGTGEDTIRGIFARQCLNAGLVKKGSSIMAEKSTRGFAAMDRAKQREIASKGGKAAHVKGTAHEFTPEEAAAAGRKGGRAAHQRGTAHEFTREEASAAGRKGGHASHQRNRMRQFEAQPMPGVTHEPTPTPPPESSSPNAGGSPNPTAPIEQPVGMGQ